MSSTVFLRCIGLIGLLGPVAWAGESEESELDRARALYRSGRYEACLEQAAGPEVELDDEEWQALYVSSLLRLGRYDQARERVTAALLENRASLHLIWLAREVLLRCGEADLAEAALAEFRSQERAGWRYRSAEDYVVRGRARLAMGEDPKRVLTDYFDAAKEDDPQFEEAYIAAAELALEKHDDALAADELREALHLAPEHPHVHFLMSRAFAGSDPVQSGVSLERALKGNPNHTGALLMSIDRSIAAESYAAAEQGVLRLLERDPHLWEAWAYRAVLAHLGGDFARESEYREKAFERWPANPGVEHLIGRELSEKYRFAEGAACQRRALVLDEDHLPARFQLAQDLLRLGEESEGWSLAREVRAEDGYNVVAYNLDVLHDVLEGYATLESEGFLVRMDAREARVYGESVLRLLQAARAELAARYEVVPHAPTVVEIFAEQKDFAIRTFGLPGGAGYLGVCFGDVVTMQSPASPGKSPSNWEATLWHEYAHVITLAKTKNRMPRWLSEGVSVYEEKRRDPAWGRAMTPAFRRLILDGAAPPLSELSRTFLEPHPELGLSFAYFASALAVEYLIEAHGFEALLTVLDGLGDGFPIQRVLRDRMAPLEELDRGFAGFLRSRAKAFAEQASWEPVEARGAQDLLSFVERHPRNLEGLHRCATELLAEGRDVEAVPLLERMCELCPQDPRPHALLAGIWEAAGEADEEIRVRRRWATRDSDELAGRERLMELCEAGENWSTLFEVATSALAIQPMLVESHRRLARAAEELGEDRTLLSASIALLELDPVDPAAAHYRIARAAHRLGDSARAKRHVLDALAEAPRFRAAQGLLLELVGEDESGSSSQEESR